MGMAAPQPSFDTIRLVNRLAVPCILDATMATRMDRDFLDALIVLAIIQANVGPLSRDPGLQLAYAAYDTPPPDAVRRPVSISAVAHSLRLPYETVRRRVLRLAGAGTCEVSDQGVIVPASALNSPEHFAAMLVVWEQIRKLYCRLRDLGLLDDIAKLEVDGQPGAAPPLRAAARIASDYMLRVVEMMSRELGGPVAGIIWFAVLRGNTERMPDSLTGEAGVSAEDFVADDQRRPVRMSELARGLRAPHETIRRYAAELIAEGLLQRTGKGLIAPAAMLARPNAVQAMRGNFTDLHRMYQALGQIGILAEWDRQYPPLRGAA
jgi:hypothetical protein